MGSEMCIRDSAKAQGAPSAVFYNYDSLNVLLSSVPIFVFAKQHLNLSSFREGDRQAKALAFVRQLSRYSFGVYLVHPMVIELLSPASSLFWSFFALNLVMLLLSYVPVFPAFLRLRARDPDAERPFRVPGGRGLLRVLAYVPMALILISIFFTAVPLSTDSETLSYYLPITVGSLISIAIGEVLIAARARRRP